MTPRPLLAILSGSDSRGDVPVRHDQAVRSFNAVVTAGIHCRPVLRCAAGLSVIVLAAAVLIGFDAAQPAVRSPMSPPRGILPPRNPARSLQPDPNFLTSANCITGQNGEACNELVLTAIRNARKALEKMPGMSFSLSAYEKLSPDEQLFVTFNLERTERGLPVATVLTRSLDKLAQAGANTNEDPPLDEIPDRLPGGGQPVIGGGNWEGGADNALGADYGWMYDDGTGGNVVGCTRTQRSSCWIHRDNILRTYSSLRQCGGKQNELAMGAGHLSVHELFNGNRPIFGDSETELLIGICGPTPTDVVFTWTQAKALLHIS